MEATSQHPNQAMFPFLRLVLLKSPATDNPQHPLMEFQAELPATIKPEFQALLVMELAVEQLEPMECQAEPPQLVEQLPLAELVEAHTDQAQIFLDQESAAALEQQEPPMELVMEPEELPPTKEQQPKAQPFKDHPKEQPVQLDHHIPPT